MIFQATHQQVLSGTKTQTRRPVKPTQWAEGIPGYPAKSDEPITAVYDTNGHLRLRWLVGKTYAVQPGRGKKSIGRIRITKIRRERLHQISPKDIIEEGFGTWVIRDSAERRVADVPAFTETWDSLHHKPHRWEDNPEVWTISFMLVDKEDE